MTNVFYRRFLIGGIFVSLLLLNLTNVTTTSAGANLSLSAFSEWENFSYDPTSVEDVVNWGGGYFIFIGQEGYLYDVSIELEVTNLGSFFGIPDSISVFGTVVAEVGNTAQLEVVVAINANETGTYSYSFENVVSIALAAVVLDNVAGDTITGRYRMEETIISKPPKESIFSADNLELLATVVGSIATVIAVLFALSKYNRGRKFRKDVDIYLLNKDMTLRDVAGQDDKKYLKLKKHLSERSLLRDADM